LRHLALRHAGRRSADLFAPHRHRTAGARAEAAAARAVRAYLQHRRLAQPPPSSQRSRRVLSMLTYADLC
jgi:hypothetical protein